MTEKISKEVQQKIMEFQEVQQQARLVLSQKYQIEIQLKESKNALDELNKQDKPEVHKVIGQLLIKTDKKNVVQELNERIETMDVRLKGLEKQEKELETKLKSLQDRLQGVFSAQGTGG